MQEGEGDMAQEDTAKVKSLYKALNILDCFLEYPFEYGVTDMAERTNLPKSTIHNIFSTFHQYGLLEYVEQTKRYRLGPKPWNWATSITSQTASYRSCVRISAGWPKPRRNGCIWAK